MKRTYSYTLSCGSWKKTKMNYIKAVLVMWKICMKINKGKKWCVCIKFSTLRRLRDEFPRYTPSPREVFFTSDVQEIHAKHIDGVAAVLSPSHFKKCEEILPQGLSFKSFLCHREFKNMSVSAFSVSKLCGYLTQPILHVMECPVMPQPPPKGLRNNRCLDPMPQCQLLPIVNGNIELLSQDSGMQGCWFRCRIVQSSERRLMVRYYDVDCVGEQCGKLEEWIPANGLAAPDKLGTRNAGRFTVRPCPDWDSSGITVATGTAIDVWWYNAWWEGVVIGCNALAKKDILVYFPGEGRLMTVAEKNIRASKDWIDNKWMDVKPRPDIVSLLLKTLNPIQKLPWSLPQANTSASANHR